MNVHFYFSLGIIVIIAFLACSKHDYDPKLVNYLMAEKNLRERVKDTNALSDSIKALQKENNFNLEKELAKLDDNPQVWVELLKELRKRGK